MVETEVQILPPALAEKKCSKCCITKLVDEFSLNKSTKDGRQGHCKQCNSDRRNEIREHNRHNLTPYARTDKKCCKCKLTKNINGFSVKLSSVDGRNEQCKVCDKARCDQYKNLNSRPATTTTEFQKRCPLCYKIKSNFAFSVNRHQKDGRQTRCKDCVSLYQNTHKEKACADEKRRKGNSFLYRLRVTLRGLIWHSIKKQGFKKNTKTAQILGCTWGELKQHLENQFWPGMTWENMGQWHLDHRVPVSSATTETEVLKLNHYTNLQPLWADDNLTKSDRLDWTPAESKHPPPGTENASLPLPMPCL